MPSSMALSTIGPAVIKLHICAEKGFALSASLLEIASLISITFLALSPNGRVLPSGALGTGVSFCSGKVLYKHQEMFQT